MVGKVIKEKTDIQHHRMQNNFPEIHKHRNMQRVKNIDECQPTCNLDDRHCYCERLKTCVNDMSNYDTGLMLVDVSTACKYEP